MVGNGDGGGAFLYAPFSSAHYRSHRHRVLIIGAVSTDGIVSSSHHLIISSVRLISLVPRCPIISSRSGGVGACHLSSKQRQHGGLLGSSSHPIPVMGRLARASRLMRLARASRPHIPGHQRVGGEDEASKRTRKNGEGPGRETGEPVGAKDGTSEGRNENGNTTGTGAMKRGRWQASKQASKG